MSLKSVIRNKNPLLYGGIFLLVIMVLSCNINKRATEDFDNFTAIYKNYVFYNQSREDSLFYFVYSCGDNLSPENVYFEEKVKRVNPTFASAKYIINQFLYSLEIYHTFSMTTNQKNKNLTITDFFTNQNFKNKYVWVEKSDSIILTGLKSIDSYDFVNQVKYDTIGNSINIYFYPTTCVLTCNITNFDNIYDRRLEFLVEKDYKIGWSPFYLKPVGFNDEDK